MTGVDDNDVKRRRRRFFEHDHPTLSCRRCGALFYTATGLAEHSRLGCGLGHGSPVRVRRMWVLTPAGRDVLRDTGRAVSARNNARRVRCAECGLTSTPSGVGTHQSFTGHTGRAEVTN
ncbi:hypothetical protein [uncultured Nocardioides sp.]|uniref:hypothetical protein n=1 Tax=uncultured Nocardioides sp. TaxID=198441 RepID=UPI002609BFF8|nr:hypothetical protein [uncultured Nocardioides sp.]